MYSIILSPTALDHLKEAIIYLDQQQPGLGTKFYKHFLNKIKILESHPILPIIYDHIMCLHLKKYKYRIHYMIDKKRIQVRILAIFHTSRNPKIWK